MDEGRRTQINTAKEDTRKKKAHICRCDGTALPAKGKSAAKAVAKVGGGLLIGFVNGFFGGGGGMLCVPLLEKILGEETKRAHATAILVILPISIASAVTYLFRGYFSLPVMLGTSGGVVTGGVLGALLLKKLPAFAVGMTFAVMMIAVGVRLIFA